MSAKKRACKMEIEKIGRKDYHQRRLDASDLDKSPFKQFGNWLALAAKANFIEPNAMAFASATSNGMPSVRMLLLKSFNERGFVFYSNYDSRKGRELQQNPFGALVFWWDKLEKQVRIEGAVEKISAEESDAYFASRPLGSQIGALASRQSTVIPDRSVLEKRMAELAQFAAQNEIKRPEDWGGYRLKPNQFEFWQGRHNRLHDRFQYRLDETGNWIIERLSP